MTLIPNPCTSAYHLFCVCVCVCMRLEDIAHIKKYVHKPAWECCFDAILLHNKEIGISQYVYDCVYSTG